MKTVKEFKNEGKNPRKPCNATNTYIPLHMLSFNLEKIYTNLKLSLYRPEISSLTLDYASAFFKLTSKFNSTILTLISIL